MGKRKPRTQVQAKRLAIWLEALRDGTYEQATCTLAKTVDGVDRFCCLGVGVDATINGEWVQIGEAGSDSTGAPIVRWDFWPSEILSDVPRSASLDDKDLNVLFGAPMPTVAELVRLNDNKMWSFEEIADFIEAAAKGQPYDV